MKFLETSSNQISFYDFMQRYSLFFVTVIIVMVTLLFITIIHYKRYKKIQSYAISLVENVPGGLAIFEYDKQIIPIYVSDEVLKIFGYTREEYTKRIFNKVPVSFVPDAEKITGFTLEQLFKDKTKIFKETFPAKRKDGSWFWLRVDTRNKYEKGKSIRVYTILSDVTKEYQNNERFGTLIDTIPGGIIKSINDKLGTITYVSDQMCNILGYTKEEFFEKYNNFSEMIYKEDRKRVFNEIKLQITQNNTYKPCIYRIQCKNGDMKWFLHVGKRTEEIDGTDSMYTLLIDYDDRQKLFEETEQYEKRLENIIANSPGGIVRCTINNGKAEFNYISEQAAKLHGQSRDEVIEWLNKDIGHYIHNDDKSRIKNNLDYAIKNEHKFNEQYRIIRTDGSYIWVSVVSNSYRDIDGLIKYYCSYTEITEMKEYMELLREEKEKTEFILKLANMSVWDYNLLTDTCIWKTDEPWQSSTDGIVTSSKKIVKNISKVTLEDSMIYEDSFNDYKEVLKSVARGEKLVSKILHMYDRKDNEYWKKVFYHTILKDGKPIGATGYSIDVTEEVKSKKAYERECKFLDEVHSEDLIDKGMINITGNKLELYKSYCGYDLCSVGITYDETLKAIINASVGDSKEKIMKDFSTESIQKAFIDGRTQYSIQYLRIIPNDRPPLWCSLTIKLFKNPETQELNAFLYTYNINDATVLSNIMNKLMIEEYNAVGIIDVRGDILCIINKSDTNISNSKKEYIYSDTIKQLVDKYFIDQDKEEALYKLDLHNLIRNLGDSKKYSVSYYVKIQSEIRCMRWDFISMNDNNSAFVYIRTDITELQKQYAEQQKRVTDALEKAEKANAAKTDFLNTMSHDIRTPMNAITNLAQMIRDDANGVGDTDIFDDLDKLDVASEFLKGLINDILDVSRIESGKMVLKPEVYAYLEFMNYISSIFEPLCEEKNINFISECGTTAYPIYVDKIRFNQLFTNIISNAVKYTNPGGTITYRVYDNIVNDNVLTCKFEISDTGCGMSEEFQKVMFKPFEREARVVSESEGTGLGLCIVKNIVELMNGNITVKSKLNEGTTFIIELSMPIASEEQVKEYYNDDNDESDNLSIIGKNVLVVEDNPMNLSILERLLHKECINTDKAFNGNEAVEKFKNSKINEYDVILMDVRMPVMGGYEATRIIRSMDREDAKSIPIIAVTADLLDEDRKDSRNAGMNDYLFKPIEPKKLYEKIRKYIKYDNTDKYSNIQIKENKLIEILIDFGCEGMDSTLSRFMNDLDFYQEMLMEMLDNDGFDTLYNQLQEEKVEEAFSTAHMLKGVIGNTGITPMYTNIVKIVESLRKDNIEGLLPYCIELKKQQQDLLSLLLSL